MKKYFLAFCICFFGLISIGYSDMFFVENVEEFRSALAEAASNGEDNIIYVKSGTYYIESTLTYYRGNMQNYSLTIEGAGKEQTILDGSLYINTSSVYGPDDKSHITIRGITFKKGSASYGGGLYIGTRDANITVEDCNFIENTATYNGGGLFAKSFSSGIVTIRNNIFTENKSITYGGGGVFAWSRYGKVIINNNEFISNTSNYRGGGAYVYSSYNAVEIEGNSFSQNSTGDKGGGLFAWSEEETVLIENNKFQENTSSDSGGGILAISHSAGIILRNNQFNTNRANQEGGGGYLDCQTGTISLENNKFINNFANWHGGGIVINHQSGKVIFINNIFKTNKASSNDGLGGGSLVTSDDGEITFINNIFCYNIADGSGGGAQLTTNGPVNLINNTFSANSSGNKGGGLYVVATSIGNIYNNIAWNNNANNIGNDLHVITAGSVNIFNNDYEDLQTLCTSTNCSFITSNNISIDPMFIDPNNGDFHLQPSSPCIDSGSASAPNLPATDFEGDPRIYGSAPDIGADEFIPFYAWQDITNLVSIYRSRTLYDLFNHCFFVLIEITNASEESLAGPVRMVIVDPTIPVLDGCAAGLSPDGYTEDGDPYFIIVTEGEELAPGESTDFLRVNFELQRVLLEFDIRVEQYK